MRLEPVHQGVYRCERGTDKIRIIVAGQVSREPHNALLHLFSASAEAVDYGAGHYQQRSQEANALLRDLLTNYRGEGIAMSYTMADYRREKVEEYFNEMTPEKQRELVRRLKSELLRSLTLEERLAGSSVEEIAAYLKKLKARRPSRKARPRRKP